MHATPIVARSHPRELSPQPRRPFLVSSPPRAGNPTASRCNRLRFRLAMLDFATMKWLRRRLAHPALMSALIALVLTGLLYGDALSLPLFSDDLIQIPWLESASWSEIWSSPSPYGFYRPVWYSLWRVWGAATGGLRPFSLHLLNLLAHFAAAWLTGMLALAWLSGEGSRRGRASSDSASDRLPASIAILVALVSTVLFVIFPFSRQAVAWPGAVYNPLVSAMAAAAVICYDRGRQHDKSRWIAVALVLAAVAAFTYEGGLMVGPLIVAVEVLGWLGRRWRRNRTWWPLAFIGLTITCYAVWRTFRGTSIGGFGLHLPELAGNLAYLAQGLVYPTAPLAQIAADTSGLPPLASLLVVAFATLALLAWSGLREGRTAFLLGLVWFVLFAVPPLASMEADWFALAPRYLYLTASGAALVWASAVGAWYRRAQERPTRHPRLAAVAIVAAAIGLLLPAVGFVRRGMRLYGMAGDAIWTAAAAGAETPPALLVNLPRRRTPHRRTYALGFEGITPLPQRVTAADLVYVHTGVRDGGEAVAFGIVASNDPADYAYDLHGREVGWVELADASRQARRVHLTRYGPSSIPLLEAGGPAPVAGATGEPLAVFADTITLREAAAECSVSGSVQLSLVWQTLTAVETDVTVFAHLVDRDPAGGTPLAQADGYPLLGMRPFWLFVPGEALLDVRTFPSVPPGQYAVRLGLWEQATGQRWDASGLPDGALTLQVTCTESGS